ncbi:uncharacterized protein LOC123692784 isoform X1 [Colias croceus]|uniref:uncharacterized protein LOC123692784 isoform X1 n=1 Tax=Colias crocea TaxID=72248 RepID=UPI001E27D0A7|nr:uncharacterized protein LOC123692784 isoform X1 [Colias croceus]
MCCKLGLVVVSIVVLLQLTETKESLESDICKDFMSYVKKHQQKHNKDDREEKDSAEDKKKADKKKNFDERLEKYLENKFPWWPKKQIEDLDATEKPKSTATPLEGLVTSYVDFVSYLFKML